MRRDSGDTTSLPWQRATGTRALLCPSPAVPPSLCPPAPSSPQHVAGTKPHKGRLLQPPSADPFPRDCCSRAALPPAAAAAGDSPAVPGPAHLIRVRAVSWLPVPGGIPKASPAFSSLRLLGSSCEISRLSPPPGRARRFLIRAPAPPGRCFMGSPSDTRCKLSSSSHVLAKNRFALRSEELGLGVLWEQGSSSASHRAVCQHVEHGDEK